MKTLIESIITSLLALYRIARGRPARFYSQLKATALLLVFMMAAMHCSQAQTWIEVGDAGEIPGTAQTVLGSGALTQINGTNTSNLERDVYKIYIRNPQKFSAVTTFYSGTGGNADNILALFDADGHGVVLSDDFDGADYLARIYGARTNSSQSKPAVTTNGWYYLAVMSYRNVPASGGTNASDQMFNKGAAGTDQIGPFDPNMIFDNWFASSQDDSPFGRYVITLTGTTFDATSPIPPDLTLLSPADHATFVSATTPLRFSIQTTDADLATNGVTLLLNGANVTQSSVISPSQGSNVVTFNSLVTNTLYSGTLTATDKNGNQASLAFTFDTFSQDLLAVEGEDYDFDGGIFLDNPLPSDVDGTNSYFGRTGTPDVDFSWVTPSIQRIYRVSDEVGTQPLISPELDMLRTKFTTAGASDYRVSNLSPGAWLNYTRTFPSGDYQIYARLASNNDIKTARLSKMPSGGGQIGIGSISAPAIGRGKAFDFFPFTDASGNKVAVRLAGKETLRFNFDGGGADLNYFLFVPSTSTTLSISRQGTTATISWSPAGGTLESATDLAGQWSPVANASNPMNLEASGNARFFRVR